MVQPANLSVVIAFSVPADGVCCVPLTIGVGILQVKNLMFSSTDFSKSRSLLICLEISVHLEAHRRSVLANRSLGVSAHTLLEEVVLILQAHILHE
jgi:hypothetical protein